MLQWHPKAGALVLVVLLVAFAGLMGSADFDLLSNFSW